MYNRIEYIYVKLNGVIMRKRIISKLCILFAMVIVTVCSFSQLVTAEEFGDFVTSVYNEESGLPTGEANDILQTSDGYIWIGSYGGLIRYDGSEFRNYSTSGEIESSSIRAMFEDSKGRLWIGTNDIGVYVYENDEFRKIKGTEENDYLCIRGFCENEEGRVFCASNSGLAEIKNEAISPLSKELNGTTFYSCAIDKSGRLWGALTSAVCIVNLDDMSVENCDYSYEDSDGTIMEPYCVAADKEGNILIGTSGNVIIRCGADGTKECIQTGNVNTHNGIRVSENGDLLVSGLRGFAVIDKDGRLTEFAETDKAASVNNAIRDYEGSYWLASSSYGVIKYTRGCYSSPNGIALQLDSVSVNAIAKQGDNYYIGHDSGLMVYSKSWEKVDTSIAEMLEGVRIRHILADGSGNVWFATYSDNAVICYDTRTKDITVYNEDNGLICNRARVIYETSDKTIVVGTQLGISYIKDGKVTLNIGAEDGLDVTQILCLYETSDGSVLAGSDGDGIYRISDGKVTKYSFENGLGEGVILRITPDTLKKDAYFVSAGSSLYYFENGQFRKLDNLEKGPGSIFDFCDKGEMLWIMQNSGVFSVDKSKLLSGEKVSGEVHGLKHGLTGSLNANTWHYTDSDGSIYLATRNGISHFGFEIKETDIPKIIVNDIQTDEEIFQHPTSMNLSAGNKRVTIDFSVLSFTDISSVAVSYKLEGFENKETVLLNQKSGEISYTNLPGGSYTFVLRIYDPTDPTKTSEQRIVINKEMKIYEQPFFIPGCIILVMLVSVLIAMIAAQHKMKILRRREKEYKGIVVQGLETLARTIDAKDKYTNGHSMRVASYSRELAKRMGMSEEEQEKVYYIALLHDIGKIGIPDAILNKPSRLTEEEFAVIKTHPLIGGEILKDFTALEGSSDGASYHHERYDGKGYGKQLAGENIPLVARIIGVADAYDAMSSDRCYRKALDSETVVGELENGIGTQFDPQIVPFMLDMIKDGVAPLKPDATHCLPEFDNIV